jgi:hypothetical protein
MNPLGGCEGRKRRSGGALRAGVVPTGSLNRHERGVMRQSEKAERAWSKEVPGMKGRSTEILVPKQTYRVRTGAKYSRLSFSSPSVHP